ncbi:MAG TPA: glycosyltransferase family 2 protein [Polyangia bacterium]
MSILVVIINYRTPELTIDCLTSLAPEIRAVPGTKVVLIDNASGDDSLPKLTAAIERHGWRDWVELIASPTNTGFAGGNNLGLETLKDHPEVRFVLLLNSDTLVEPGMLRYCLGVMEADRSLGLMSCLLLNADRTVQNTARKFPTPLRLVAQDLALPWVLPRLFAWADTEDPEWDRRGAARDVDWVGGAFMLVRRDVIDRIGGLDDGFFFYGEDAEFCHRIRANGWRVRYDPGAAIVHLGGASSDPARLAARQRNVLQWQARYLLQRRCYGRSAEWLVRGADIAGSALRYFKMVALGEAETPRCQVQRDVLTLLLTWPTASASGKT